MTCKKKKRTISFRDSIQQNINVLTTNEYWKNNVPNNFKSIVAYSLRHYNTVNSELHDILTDLEIEVQEHHVNRLKKISTVAQEINVDIGRIWHNQYNNKEYGNENFGLVENIYDDTRGMAV